MNVRTTVVIYVLITGSLLTSIFLGFFPTTFIEGSGLTLFKIISEYIISVILVASILFLWKYREKFDNYILYLLITSISLTVFAELAFTFYVSVYGLSNSIGHFFKIIAFYLIYLALIQVNLKQPYRLLFRKLTESNKELETKSQELKKEKFETEKKAERFAKMKTATINALRDMKESRDALVISEKKILEEKNFSDGIINSLPGVFYLFDSNGKYLKWNNNFEKITKYSTDEISKIKPDQFFLGKDKEKVKEAIRATFEKGQAVVEAEIVSKDGEKTPFYLTGVRIVRGEKSYIVGVGLDLSKVKKTEKALQDSEESLGFVTMISHQLRTPVSAAQGALEAIRDDVKTEEIQDAFDKINNLNDIIGTMLFYIENKGKTQERGKEEEKVDIVKTINEQMSLLEDIIENKKIVLRQALLSEAMVSGKQVILNRIVYSILHNAIMYNKEHGNIDISLKEEKDSIVLEVGDTGYGIPEKEQNKVFTEYFRATNASLGLNEGSGLSLYLTAIMMKLLGGKITFKSTEDSGSTFTLRFPAN